MRDIASLTELTANAVVHLVVLLLRVDQDLLLPLNILCTRRLFFPVGKVLLIGLFGPVEFLRVLHVLCANSCSRLLISVHVQFLGCHQRRVVVCVNNIVACCHVHLW